MQGGEPVVTFEVDGRVDDVVDELVTSGFVLESPAAVRTTVLDTFDGRLHRTGRRLRVEAAASRIDLVLSVDGCDVARTGVDAIPRSADDLPRGDPWTGAVEAIAIRALRPMLVVGWSRQTAYRRNSTGDLVAVADLLSDVSAEGRRSVPLRSTMVEVRAIGRSGRAARRACDALAALGCRRSDVDTVARCASVADVALCGFAPPSCGPLATGMPAFDGIRTVLTPLAASIEAQWDGAVERVDTEFVHQLRVALRRTRTILAAADSLFPPDLHRRVTVDFAWLAGLTSTPRDLDVCLLNWTADTADVAADTARALEPVRDLLERRRTESYEVLATAMRSRRARSLRTEWGRWLTEPPDADAAPARAQPLGPLVAQLIRRGHRQLVRDGRGIDESSPATELHELRKDAKRLRYLVDGFGAILPAQAAADLLAPLKTLQAVLGRHQDADIQAALLASTAPELAAEGAPPATSIALGRMLERQDARARRARAEFAVAFARFDRPKTRRAVEALVDALA